MTDTPLSPLQDVDRALADFSTKPIGYNCAAGYDGIKATLSKCADELEAALVLLQGAEPQSTKGQNLPVSVTAGTAFEGAGGKPLSGCVPEKRPEPSPQLPTDGHRQSAALEGRQEPKLRDVAQSLVDFQRLYQEMTWDSHFGMNDLYAPMLIAICDDAKAALSSSGAPPTPAQTDPQARQEWQDSWTESLKHVTVTPTPEPSREKPVEQDLRWWAEMMGPPSTAWRNSTQKLLIRAAEEIERLRASSCSPNASELRELFAKMWEESHDGGDYRTTKWNARLEAALASDSSPVSPVGFVAYRPSTQMFTIGGHHVNEEFARRVADDIREFLPASSCSPRPNRFDCTTCGQGVAVDEDGCCRTCGKDAIPVLAASSCSRETDTRRMLAAIVESAGPAGFAHDAAASVIATRLIEEAKALLASRASTEEQLKRIDHAICHLPRYGHLCEKPHPNRTVVNLDDVLAIVRDARAAPSSPSPAPTGEK